VLDSPTRYRGLETGGREELFRAREGIERKKEGKRGSQGGFTLLAEGHADTPWSDVTPFVFPVKVHRIAGPVPAISRTREEG